jgi:hypothetical protein
MIGATLLVLFADTGAVAYEATRPCRGSVTADTFEDEPNEDAVIYDDSEFPDSEHIDKILQKATNSGVRRSIVLTGQERKRLLNQMSDFYQFGNSWYINCQNETVTMTTWCVDPEGE